MTRAALAVLVMASTACLPFRDDGLYRCEPTSDGKCSADCVCEVFAVSDGERLNAIWGSGARDVWAAGTLGQGRQAAHFDGTGWKRVALPEAAEIFGLWGASAADVWAVGDRGVIFHWDGAAWSKATSPTTALINAVNGASATEVWAVSYFTTDDRNVLKLTGGGWSLEPAGPTGLYAVLPFAANDVWAAGVEWGAVQHYDGTRWQRVEMVNIETIRGAFGLSSTDFWLAAGKGLAHGDGDVLERRHASETALRAVWASGAKDVWAAGEGGVLLRGDGEKFTSLKSGVTGTLTGVWGSGPGDVYAVGENGVLRFHP
ncbi:MAG: hypothetical protein JNK82_15750 [Myxococcaceae bacterium]|nr:hypothetical protein [Myxococcaceae bacterium]